MKIYLRDRNIELVEIWKTTLLKTAKKHNIKSLLCPGLATSIGKMSYQNCAKQMLKAYEDFLNPVYYDILGDANKVHLKMIGN